MRDGGGKVVVMRDEKNAVAARCETRDRRAERRAAPLMIRVLRREREDAVPLAPRRVRDTIERGAPGVGRENTREQLEQRGLAGAVRSAQPVGAAWLEHDACILEDVAPGR